MTLDGAMFMAAGDANAFDPLELGLSLLLDADAITGLSDGAAIATWADGSGNARDASQATAGKRPTFTATIDGGAAVKFDPASSQHLQVPGYFPGNDATAKMTMFVVARSLVSTVGGVAALRRGASSGWETRVNSALANEFMYANLGASPASLRDSVGLTTTGWNVYEVIRDGLVTKIGHNGTLVSTTFSAYTAQMLTALCIGGEDTTSTGSANGTFFNGYIKWLGILERIPTDGERDALEGYLGARFAIPIA